MLTKLTKSKKILDFLTILNIVMAMVILYMTGIVLGFWMEQVQSFLEFLWGLV